MQQLYLVGSGPGHPDSMTVAAQRAIAVATDLVAYALYLDLLGELAHGKTLHPCRLGEEVERARLALNLAAGNNTTALISSGDIGIYAMAAPVFELLDRQVGGREAHPEWLEVGLEVVPGVSAMQTLSSRVGALLGHDFCSISLSNLLTPWSTISRRIHCAGRGDFVVAFYNPISDRRDWQLDTARDILLEYRDGETPVVLGRNLERANEEIRFTTLAALDAQQVDMLTLVCVGSSASRLIVNRSRTWAYTPRGYGGEPA